MRPINRGDKPTHITLSGETIDNAAQEYQFSIGALISRLGEYCSYCEIALGANLTIDHVVPKSTSVNQENDWSNFLLACPNCNSRKGTRVQDRAGYYWPDDIYISQATTGFNTFSILEYYWDTNSMVALVRRNPNLPAGVVPAYVDSTIDIVKLNNYDPNDSDPKRSDRRVRNRTRTWEIASSMANTLSSYYARYTNTGDDNTAMAKATADKAISALKRQITQAALAGGFWSVWMTVFSTKGTFINPAVRIALLNELFVTPFPGTRYP